MSLNLSVGSSAPVCPKVPMEGWQWSNKDPGGHHLLNEKEAGPQRDGGSLWVLP